MGAVNSIIEDMVKDQKEKILEHVTQKKRYKTIFHKFLRDVHFRKKIIFLSVVAIALVWFFWGIPLPTSLGQQEPVSSQIFDRNGKLIYEIYADKRRSPIKLGDLPDYVKNATVAIEDKDFYKHSAFSPTGVIRAIYNTVLKRNVQGGSTLTQQLV